jgi:arylsulfatase A-like enzyme
VHTPIQAKEEMISKYEDKPAFGRQSNPRYAAMVETVDYNIGRLLDELDAQGIDKNTLVVFTSDNGGVWRNTSMEPLRAGKGSYYEGGIRVPLVIRWSGSIRGGRKSDTPVTGIDFYPTFRELIGSPNREENILDGTSLVPVLLEKGRINDRSLFWHFPIYLENGNPETRDPVFRTRPGSVVRIGDWKLHEYFEDNGIELYDLKNDIGEKQNLAEKHPGLVRKLHSTLVEWRNKVGAPVPSDLNPDYDAEYDRTMRLIK